MAGKVIYNMEHDPKYWIVRVCKYCGKEFETYKKYVERGGGKFCSHSCAQTYRNIHNNPSKKKEVRDKISENHADVSGKNNPMYGITGDKSPSYIDGRDEYSEYYRFLAFTNFEHKCSVCGKEGEPEDFDVHHKDGDKKNNCLENLEIVCPKCHLTVRHNYIRDKNGKFIGSE